MTTPTTSSAQEMTAVDKELPGRAYYSHIKSLIFGRTDWRALEAAAKTLPKAKILISKEYDFSAPSIAYDFIVDLSQQFGRSLEPIGLESGCIGLYLAFRSSKDFLNRDFRYLMLRNEVYHALFRDYDVSRIYVYGFPNDGPARLANIVHSNFRVDNLGQPTPH